MTRTLTTIALLLALGSCQAAETQARWFRSIDRLGDGLRRHLSPGRGLEHVGRRLQHIGSWHNPPRPVLDSGSLKRTVGTTVSEVRRQVVTGPQRMQRFAADSLTRTSARFSSLANPAPGLPRILDVRRPGERIEHAADIWDDVLDLRHRPLASPTDLRHRTDPDDDRPVEGWGERVLKRVGL